MPEAWQTSRELLGIDAKNFILKYDSQLEDITNFRNNQKIDCLYLDGVPFNKNITDGSSVLNEDDSWYGIDEWIEFLNNIHRNLNDDGMLKSYLTFGLNEALMRQLREAMIDRFEISWTFSTWRETTSVADIVVKKIRHTEDSSSSLVN